MQVQTWRSGLCSFVSRFGLLNVHIIMCAVKICKHVPIFWIIEKSLTHFGRQGLCSNLWIDRRIFIPVNRLKIPLFTAEHGSQRLAPYGPEVQGRRTPSSGRSQSKNDTCQWNGKTRFSLTKGKRSNSNMSQRSCHSKAQKIRDMSMQVLPAPTGEAIFRLKTVSVGSSKGPAASLENVVALATLKCH